MSRAKRRRQSFEYQTKEKREGQRRLA